MQVVRDESNKDLLQEAGAAVREGELEKAVSLYKSVIQADAVNQLAYERLFILLRKLKDYKQELKMLKAGIKAFEQLNAQRQKKSKKITELSNLLNKATGLVDKKGNMVYKPEPIPKWEKRKAIVEKKLK